MGFLSKIFNSNNPKINTNVHLTNNINDFPWSKLDKIEKKYENIVNMHFKLIEKIKMNYTIVMNLGDVFSPQMDSVINDCLKDISLAQDFYNYCKEKAEYYNEPIENHLPLYDSFKRLSIIYEKRKEYIKAIEICQQAITIGFYKDGTDGQLPGRIARLYKKVNKLG